MEYKTYKCDVCGNVIELVVRGDKPNESTLTCCGEPMRYLKPKATDAGSEKHVPVVEINGKDIIIDVGSVPHPMEEKHYIQWIAINADNQVYRTYLKPGDKPRTKIALSKYPGSICVRAYCNVHGLWETCAE